MSEPSYLKAACALCGEHIEFPAEAAGATVACPHCAGQTTLQPIAATARSRKGLWIGVACSVVLLGVVCAAFVLLQKKDATPSATTDAVSQPAPSVESAEAKSATPPADEPSNVAPGLTVGSYKLERAKVGKLVYVIGTVKNQTASQFFKLKIEFDLVAKNGAPAGKASDSLRNLAPKATWDFKALVVEDGAAKATLAGLTGEKE
jgi:hypothetical protein